MAVPIWPTKIQIVTSISLFGFVWVITDYINKSYRNSEIQNDGFNMADQNNINK